MKSAYELAMSRLEKENPLPKVAEAMRVRLAEVDNEITARIAEKKVFLEGEMAKSVGDPDAVSDLRRQLMLEIARLEELRETRKEKIRASEKE